MTFRSKVRVIHKSRLLLTIISSEWKQAILSKVSLPFKDVVNSGCVFVAILIPRSKEEPSSSRLRPPHTAQYRFLIVCYRYSLYVDTKPSSRLVVYLGNLNLFGLILLILPWSSCNFFVVTVVSKYAELNFGFVDNKESFYGSFCDCGWLRHPQRLSVFNICL